MADLSYSHPATSQRGNVTQARERHAPVFLIGGQTPVQSIRDPYLVKKFHYKYSRNKLMREI